MNFITNVSNNINPMWYEHCMLNTGKGVPRDRIVSTDHDAMNSHALDTYKKTEVHHEVFDKDNANFLDVPAFFPNVVKYKWWITKMMPRQFMPMHYDAFKEKISLLRLWIPLQDYEPGHVFIYDNKLMADYKAGDMYEYNNEILHGAANIGFSPRLTLLISIFEYNS